MKRIVHSLMVGGLLLSGTAAWSYSISVGGTATDVGAQDEMYPDGWTTLGTSSEADEAAWVSGLLGEDVSVTWRSESDDPDWTSKWHEVTDDTTANPLMAFDLDGSPEWFIVKLGGGGKTPFYTHYLFQNNESFDWAVISLSFPTVGGDPVTLMDIGRVSHVTEMGGGQVPEPGTMLLLGSGLLGLAGIGRRRSK